MILDCLTISGMLVYIDNAKDFKRTKLLPFPILHNEIGTELLAPLRNSSCWSSQPLSSFPDRLHLYIGTPLSPLSSFQAQFEGAGMCSILHKFLASRIVPYGTMNVMRLYREMLIFDVKCLFILHMNKEICCEMFAIDLYLKCRGAQK